MEDQRPRDDAYELRDLRQQDHDHAQHPRPSDLPQEPLLPLKSPTAKSHAFSHDSLNTAKSNRKAHLKSSWWYWEIGGAFLAILGLFLTIAVLAVLDNKPIERWNERYDIQPSSLLSTLTTIGRMGMMLVLASCVSQLKWMHFHHSAHQLMHLELFDEVSRASPMSTLKMLWTLGPAMLKVRADMIAMFLALVTLGSFAIDPMVQQILSTQVRDVALGNVTASVGASIGYKSYATEALVRDSGGNNSKENATRALDLHMTLLSQLINAPIQPDLDCPYPATRCTFDDFSTIGLCRDYANIDDRSTRTCTRLPRDPDQLERFTPTPPETYVECRYEVENMPTTRNLSITFGNSSAYQYENFRSILDIIDYGTSFPWGEPYDIARLFVIHVEDGKYENTFLNDTALEVPETHISMANWYWCEHTYSGVTRDVLTDTLSGMDKPNTIPLNARIMGNDVISSRINFTAPGSDADYYSDFLDGQFMNRFSIIDVKHLQMFGDWQGTMKHETYQGGFLTSEDFEVYEADRIGISNFMSQANMSEVTQNIATAVTNQVLQNKDNGMFATHQGTAYQRTTFYSVQWAWLVLPLLEAVATAILLIFTMWSNKLPVLKSSNIALLAHGPEDAIAYRVEEPETKGKWEKMGEEVRVVLAKDESGWMRLTRSDSLPR